MMILSWTEFLQKASRPSGRGWESIPRGRKGGKRRRNSKGGYDYWYPDAKAAPKKKRKKRKTKAKAKPQVPRESRSGKRMEPIDSRAKPGSA